jgi:hypothetical protein
MPIYAVTRPVFNGVCEESPLVWRGELPLG